MRFKLVPEAPEDLARVREIQAAVPLVPGNEDDCCARIMDRTGVGPRDEARTWLTFLRALGLAREGPAGFSRVREEPDADRLREAFRGRCYGADVVLEILEDADRPLESEEVYDRFREEIPAYEQHRWSNRLDEVWGERVERLLGWARLFDLAERTAEDGRYRRG